MARRTAAVGDATPALFADQSHSIVDNLVALLPHSRAWNCSVTVYWVNSRFRVSSGHAFMASVLLNVTHRGHRESAPLPGWGAVGFACTNRGLERPPAEPGNHRRGNRATEFSYLNYPLNRTSPACVFRLSAPVWIGFSRSRCQRSDFQYCSPPCRKGAGGRPQKPGKPADDRNLSASDLCLARRQAD